MLVATLAAMALWVFAGALLGGDLAPPTAEWRAAAGFGLPLAGFGVMIWGLIFSEHLNPTVHKVGIALTILGFLLPWVVPVFYVVVKYTCLPEIFAGGV